MEMMYAGEAVCAGVMVHTNGDDVPPGGCDARAGETMHTNGDDVPPGGCDARVGETMHTNGGEMRAWWM